MILKGKKVVIMGVRNKWSIAWGAAQSAYEQGAEVICLPIIPICTIAIPGVKPGIVLSAKVFGNWQKDRLCDLLLRPETCILTVERRRFSCAASNEKEGYRTCVLLTKIFPNRN